mgnify:CR=1 FL=1
MNDNNLFYLQDNFNICLDIRMIIKDIILHDTLCNKQIKKTTIKNKEINKQIQYYIWLNKTINKRKHKEYSLLNTIKHFDS